MYLSRDERHPIIPCHNSETDGHLLNLFSEPATQTGSFFKPRGQLRSAGEEIPEYMATLVRRADELAQMSATSARY